MELNVAKNAIIKHVAYPECEFCEKSAELFTEYSLKYATITCDKSLFGEILKKSGGNMNVPQIIYNGELIGGYDELKETLEKKGA